MTQAELLVPDGKPLIEIKEQQTLTPLELVNRAMLSNLPPEALKQVMDFVERVDALNARKAFAEAMNRFKADPPTITKNKGVSYKEVKYKYATLDHVCDEITSALSKAGIFHHYETAQAEGVITVTCILTHEKGHSERTTLQGLPDTSGSKNAIQAIGSTVTYLQRYTLLAATGLAAEGTDNDGAGGEETGKLANLQDHLANISSANAKELMRFYFTALDEAKKCNDKEAPAKLSEAKEKRKKELGL